MARSVMERCSAKRRNSRRLAVAAAILLALAAGWFGLGARSVEREPPALTAMAIAARGRPPSGPQRSLLAGQPWLNTPPLRPEDLRGKVVLVNFWTYSCINSLRPLPYLRAWSAKYRDRGLVVVGVHTPEFGFEKDVANVRRASLELGVDFPVVLDSDYEIWRAYGNQAWPAFYFIGADGKVHRRTQGEGGYDESERLLQKLLSEANGAAVADPIVPVAGQGAQAAPDWRNIASGETYIGYANATAFASPGGLARDRTRVYRGAERLALNRWSLAGAWTVGGEFASLDKAPGAIAHRFRARDLHMVMGPPADGRTIRFRVRLDGGPPGPDHGVDTDAEGWGEIKQPRMYQLVRQSRPVGDRTFQIEFFDSGARAYVFTFG